MSTFQFKIGKQTWEVNKAGVIFTHRQVGDSKWTPGVRPEASADFDQEYARREQEFLDEIRKLRI